MPGPDPRDVLGALLRHHRATRQELEAYQTRLLRRLVRHAYQRVPYYRALFDRHGLTPADVRGLEDLSRIPVTPKRELRDQPVDAVLARGVAPDRLIVSRTSGSTGEPFAIRRTWLEQNLSFLFRLRTYRDFGIRPGDQVVRLGMPRKRPAVDARHDSKIIGRLLRAAGLLRRSLVDLRAPLPELADQLARGQPEVLRGYAGAIARLAVHLRETGDARIRPRAVIVGAEVLTPAMRQVIREAFDAPVRDIYGSYEFDVIAWECSQADLLHVCDDAVILELLVDGRPAREGEVGEVVLTALHAYAMPFIRYRIGDLATRGPAGCPCGLAFSTIRSVQGRMLDYLPLPDGRMLHPYQLIGPAVRESGLPIGQYQLVQERLDRVVLRVVLPSGWPTDAVRAAEQSLAALLGSSVEFRIEPVRAIAPEANGKYRHVRSHVWSAYDQPEEALAAWGNNGGR